MAQSRSNAFANSYCLPEELLMCAEWGCYYVQGTIAGNHVNLL